MKWTHFWCYLLYAFCNILLVPLCLVFILSVMPAFNSKQQKQKKNGPDRGHWSHIQMLCIACPAPAHCHSGLMSLWQQQPLTQGWDCLKEKETDTNGEIIAEFLAFLLPLCSPNSRRAFSEIWVWWALLLIAPQGRGADIPLCVAMTVILCHCSSSRSNSITVLIKPVSEAMRNRASGSDWGSMEYLR